MNLQIRRATDSDAEAIVKLVNRAFEVERFFKDRDRTDLNEINGLLRSGTFFLLTDDTQLVARVYVQIRGQRGYIGLLSVDPDRQGSGHGTRLMEHAEDYCGRAGCQAVDLRIVHLRTELLAFYGKRGYAQQGTESAHVIKGAKLPVHFVLMSKELKTG
jgi:GNAT superfamily N-acetyltransferase